MSSLSDFRSGLRKQINSGESHDSSNAYFSTGNRANTSKGTGHAPSLSLSKLMSSPASQQTKNNTREMNVSNLSNSSNKSGLSSGFVTSFASRKEDPRQKQEDTSLRAKTNVYFRNKGFLGAADPQSDSNLTSSSTKPQTGNIVSPSKISGRANRSVSNSGSKNSRDLDRLLRDGAPLTRQDSGASIGSNKAK